MKATLESLRASLASFPGKDPAAGLLNNVATWLEQMEPIQYDCLGCQHCFPAEAMNAYEQASPEVTTIPSCDRDFDVSKENRLSPLQFLLKMPAMIRAIPSVLKNRSFEIRERTWPPVPGEYFVLGNGRDCPVAVSTLASVELAEKLAAMRPMELCIVGKTETENIGIDKVVKNTTTNPTIRFLLLVGKDPQGHHSGRTLLALVENGVDENMRVIGSPSRRAILRNVTREEVEVFRKQVQVVDRIGCEDAARIVETIKELARMSHPSSGCAADPPESKPVQVTAAPTVQATEPGKVELDKAGYFVIIPQPEKEILTVEHYSYDNKLLRVIEGTTAKDIYASVIGNGWITQLSHAAYLGKELARAELSMKMGFKYIQDGA